MKLTKEIIDGLKSRGLNYSEIARKFKVSHQRVHQVRTRYRSPFNIIPVEKLKNLNKRKRAYLNLPDVKIQDAGGVGFRREIVRARDSYTCKICGRIWDGKERRFDIHHIDEDSSKTKKLDSLEDFNNLVTLCHKCHIRLHYRLVSLPK